MPNVVVMSLKPSACIPKMLYPMIMKPMKRKTRMTRKVERSWSAWNNVFAKSIKSFCKAKYLSALTTRMITSIASSINIKLYALASSVISTYAAPPSLQTSDGSMAPSA